MITLAPSFGIGYSDVGLALTVLNWETQVLVHL
jgi:hypothetical protein